MNIQGNYTGLAGVTVGGGSNLAVQTAPGTVSIPVEVVSPVVVSGPLFSRAELDVPNFFAIALSRRANLTNPAQIEAISNVMAEQMAYRESLLAAAYGMGSDAGREVLKLSLALLHRMYPNGMRDTVERVRDEALAAWASEGGDVDGFLQTNLLIQPSIFERELSTHAFTPLVVDSAFDLNISTGVQPIEGVVIARPILEAGLVHDVGASVASDTAPVVQPAAYQPAYAAPAAGGYQSTPSGGVVPAVSGSDVVPVQSGFDIQAGMAIAAGALGLWFLLNRKK